MRLLITRTLAAVGCMATLGCGGGTSFPFKPSNLPADLALTASDDLIFNGEKCGPRAELDTNTGEIRCFSPGGFSPKFAFTVNKAVLQSDGTEVAVFIGRNIRIEANSEVQVRGDRPLVLVALETMVVRGRLTGQDSILQYKGHGGGASEPAGAPSTGLGPGGGKPGNGGSGSGGAAFCGEGGKGGDAINPTVAGALGGSTYGTQALVPLVGGSSGGRSGNHAGAGGGAVQLVAGVSLEVAAGAAINLGGGGGGWSGAGAVSGGALLLESPTVTIAGTLAVNGGGGGGGAAAGGQDGVTATPDDSAAAGGAGGVNGGNGGAGSAADQLNGAPGQGGDSAGGGGGGAGRIRINTRSGSATLTGKLSPQPGTACTTQGTVTSG